MKGMVEYMQKVCFCFCSIPYIFGLKLWGISDVLVAWLIKQLYTFYVYKCKMFQNLVTILPTFCITDNWSLLPVYFIQIKHIGIILLILHNSFCFIHSCKELCKAHRPCSFSTESLIESLSILQKFHHALRRWIECTSHSQTVYFT